SLITMTAEALRFRQSRSPVARRPLSDTLLAEQQLRQLVRRAQHRVVAGGELVVRPAETLRRPALMMLRRIHGLRAPGHRRGPLLIPERRGHHRRLERGDGMRRDPVERPRAHRRLEILEHAVLGVLTRWAGGEIADLVRRRALDDRVYALAGQQRERVDEVEACDPVARLL